MTNSNETQNKKVLAAQTKGEKEMPVENVKKHKPRKLNVAYQQDIIEVFGYIYQSIPQKNTYYSLAHEMSKSVRTIKRMIDDLNDVCRCVTLTNDEITNCAYFTIEYDNINEKEFDKAFGDLSNAPLLYVFLKSFFIRKMSLEELMQEVVVLKKRNICKNPTRLQKAKKFAACDIIRGILKTTYLVGVNKENGICQIGNIDFLDF